MKNKLTSPAWQNEVNDFVNKHVYYVQTTLVNELLDNGMFEYPDTQEDVFEWWIVSNFLLQELEKRNEVILKNDFGEWWGRCATGQAITLDGVINEICEDTKE